MVKDKVLIVTGAGSGIGLTTAHVLAGAGAKVVVADINIGAAQGVANEIRDAGGEAAAVMVDVADEASVAAMVAFAVDTYGRLDGAHNNAGIEMASKPLHELTADEWGRVVHIDLTGVFYCLKHQFLAMKDSGGGAIVNTASSSGIRATMNSAEYTSAKHGVVGLTKCAAIDGAPLGIRVNAICPGLIMTPMAKDRLMNDPGFSVALEGIRQRHVIGRFGEPKEIADAVMWLLSDQSTFMTGAPMLVDGGFAI
ncbi:SDR family NAD(P)-dependent oxidoreductase [Sphingosinicella soli]|uniref:NAD(P)-dependent dehydrogenase (Short-subunit alcohol dehydrogenase family) n=1 Tax=Sphingosinicella soli TaxID=333708 RepID=A0A7W7B095_9SPHN|nr:glucose 1-dehydrogenase [Sphingosinicella soli]MBB4631632.1 NAD(P)-dependent dehydrogenase (short-subunit alcohol dehydrogenase family) [Sphingosinicella soli]